MKNLPQKYAMPWSQLSLSNQYPLVVEVINSIIRLGRMKSQNKSVLCYFFVQNLNSLSKKKAFLPFK